MKKLIIFLCLFGFFFSKIESQTYSHLDSSKIKKESVSIKIDDARQNPLIVGDGPVQIFIIQEMNPRVKSKDKKGVIFPSIKEVFKESLKQKGFSLEENQHTRYLLHIRLTEIYFKEEYRFTHTQINQFCKILVTLSEIGESQSIYQKEFFAPFSCSRADLKMFGYKYNFKKPNFLLLSAKTAINSLLREEEFQNLFIE